MRLELVGIVWRGAEQLAAVNLHREILRLLFYMRGRLRGEGRYRNRPSPQLISERIALI